LIAGDPGGYWKLKIAAGYPQDPPYFKQYHNKIM
jgi:hypothetical protein